MDRDPTPDRLRPSACDHHDGSRTLSVTLDEFAWETLSEQSAQLGVDVDELVVFATLYYIADLDSKRIARRLPTELRSRSRTSRE
ncbi:MAG TPA: hypothetical protein VK756_00435 [Solirubrobacteraceae bacterium]|jgi:hypothetical protein|nr:hypothetical protein [Solirubrobacteraceae bacterium]